MFKGGIVSFILLQARIQNMCNHEKNILVLEIGEKSMCEFIIHVYLIKFKFHFQISMK